jgi:hypothetical protein
MRKYLFLLIFLSACTSNPIYRGVDDQAIHCFQTEEQKKSGVDSTCLEVPTYRDTYKWHKVRDWQDLPPIPDTP